MHRDPPLKDAIEAYRPRCTDKRALTGLDQLDALAPPGVRLSWLRESAAVRGQKPPRNISALYGRAIEEGRKPSSVRRSLHRAVRELLVYEFDEEGARQRLAGLSGRIPREDDERKVRVSPDELRQLIATTDVDRFRWMILAAILTTADRGPLLKTIPRHFNDDAGTLEIYDRKTKHRHRLVALGSSARTILRLATAGLEDDERVFPWTVWQVRNMWAAARDRAAGRPSRMQRRWGQKLPDPIGDEAAAFFEQEGVVTLPVLRFKDLRHLLPTALAALKVDRREIQAILGHAHGSRTSDRYITPAGDVANLDAAAELLGLKDAHLAR